MRVVAASDINRSKVMTESQQPSLQTGTTGHTRWVRISHWIVTVSFLTLAFTGFVILMAHPRLYWGEAGNNLTPALFELPISRNHQHGGWEKSVPFFQDAASPVSASRTYEIFNKNGWGRSLHFLAAWFLVVPGAVYLLAGIFTGHFRRHVVPRAGELTPRLHRAGSEKPSAPANPSRDRRAALRSSAKMRLLRGRLLRAAAGGGDRPGDVTRRLPPRIRSCRASSADSSPPAPSTSLPPSSSCCFCSCMS